MHAGPCEQYVPIMETIEHIRNLPRLSSESIHIWGIHVPDMLDRLDALENVLTDGEREKASRFHRASDRQSSIASRGALRILLAGYTGLATDKIRFAYSGNGKPHLDGSNVAFNVSHSGDWVVLAIGCDRSVGVDIEKIKREMDVGPISSRYFSPDEHDYLNHAEDVHAAFFQLWVRKEAYIKACGSTLFAELKGLSVPTGDGAEKDGWFYHDLEAGSKYAAAVVTDQPLGRIPCYDFGGLKWQN